MCHNSSFLQQIENPDVYLTVLHFNLWFEVPIHTICGYCVLWVTPQKMATVKTAMVTLYIWGAFYDFYLNFLSIPYIFFPAFAGFPLGVISNFGVPTSVQVYIGLSFLGVTACAILGFFENRYHCLLGARSSYSTGKKLKRAFYMPLMYSTVFITFAASYLDIPEPDVAKTYLIETIECIPLDLIDRPTFFVLTTNTRLPVLSWVFEFVIINSQMIYYIIHIFKYLATCKTTSPTTYRMQSDFLKALTFQVLFPVGAISIPVIYYLLVIILSYHNQAVNNIMMIWLSIHGCFSSIVMILVHKPYRDILFCNRTRLKSITPSKLSIVKTPG